MKSLIMEKNKMGLEEEPELLVKGESTLHWKQHFKSIKCFFFLFFCGEDCHWTNKYIIFSTA